MGMKSSDVEEEKGLEVQHEESEKKEKADACSIQDFLHKDDSRLKSPSSPAAISLRADGKEKRLAEVFRTDFITAMKVPDSQMLQPGKKFTLTDAWKQEWEKGVQVPVNPDALPDVTLRKIEAQTPTKRPSSFSLPKNRITFDNPEYAHTNAKHSACNYDLDDFDVRWLGMTTTKNKRDNINESVMEKAMTYFERKCFEKMAHAVATKKGLSIEYDETTICDVCLSPDTEESNEIVFCDACNMSAHQACYGIPEIPSGTWLCRPCSRGILSPPCVICPNQGGAMKRLKNSFEWIHVICAWWVPEVKIEDIDNVERITIDKIPASRKNLSCHLCREKMGACIQCSVKRCVTAYHVTCGVKMGLELKTVMLHEKDDVQHISYCKRHCVPSPPDKHKQRAGENVENQRLQELQKLQETFYKLINVPKAAKELRLSREPARKIFAYWVLKRKANENRPLIPLTTEQQEKLSGKQGIFLIQEQINVEMERYALLRQDLERLRNLCYLIIRRERVKREVHKASQEVFLKQNEVLTDDNIALTDKEFQEISTDPRAKFTKFPFYSMYGPPFADHIGEEEQSKQESNNMIGVKDNNRSERMGDLKDRSKAENIGNSEDKTTSPQISESIVNLNDDKIESNPESSTENKTTNESSAEAKAVQGNEDDSNSYEFIDNECKTAEVKDSKENSTFSTVSSQTIVEHSNSDSQISAIREDTSSSSYNSDAAWTPSGTFVDQKLNDSKAEIDENIDDAKSKETSFAQSSLAKALKNHKSPKKRAKSRANNCYVVINRVLRSSPRQNKYNGGFIDFQRNKNCRAKQSLILDFLKPKGDTKILEEAANNEEINGSLDDKSEEINKEKGNKDMMNPTQKNFEISESSEENGESVSGLSQNEDSRRDSDSEREIDIETRNFCNSEKKDDCGRVSASNDDCESENTENCLPLPTENGLVDAEIVQGENEVNSNLGTAQSHSTSETESLGRMQESLNGDPSNKISKQTDSMITPSSSMTDGDLVNGKVDFQVSRPSEGKVCSKEYEDACASDVTMATDDEESMPRVEVKEAGYDVALEERQENGVNEAADKAMPEERPDIEVMEESNEVEFREGAETEAGNERIEAVLEERPVIESAKEAGYQMDIVSDLKQSLKTDVIDIENQVFLKEANDELRDTIDALPIGNGEDILNVNNEGSAMYRKNCDLFLKEKFGKEETDEIALSAENQQNEGLFENGGIEHSGMNSKQTNSRSPVVLLRDLSPDSANDSELNTELNCKHTDRETSLFQLKNGKKRSFKAVDNNAYPSSVIDELIACPQRLTRRRTHSMVTGESVVSKSPTKSKRKHVCSDAVEDHSVLDCSPEPYLIDELTACPQRLTRRRAKSLGVDKINNELDKLNNFKRRKNCHLKRNRTSKRTRWSSMGETDVGDFGNPDLDPLTELVACPQRLTRASVKSLGLVQSDGDLSVSS